MQKKCVSFKLCGVNIINDLVSQNPGAAEHRISPSVLFSPLLFNVRHFSISSCSFFSAMLFEIQLYLLFISYITFKKFRTIDFPIPFFLFRINS